MQLCCRKAENLLQPNLLLGNLQNLKAVIFKETSLLKCKPTAKNIVITSIITVDINIAIPSKEVINLSVFAS